jgi:superfamily II DNA/RNA helicase
LFPRPAGVLSLNYWFSLCIYRIVVGTLGQLIDMLEKKRLVLNSCKYLCMDEADRMIDLGFEDDVRNIMSFFSVCLLT